MGQSPSTMFLLLLLFVIVAVLIYRNYHAEDQTLTVKTDGQPNPEEEED